MYSHWACVLVLVKSQCVTVLMVVLIIGSLIYYISYLLTDTNLLNLVHWYSDEADNLIQLTVVAVNEVTG